MGVIYKLKAQIKEFILEQRKIYPNLGCRKLTALIEGKFQIKVSKSSINSILKEAGLSMPVGRRRKKKRRKIETPLIAALPPPPSPTPEKPTPPPRQVPVEPPTEIPPQEPQMPAEMPKEPSIEMPAEIPAQEPIEIAHEAPKEVPHEVPREIPQEEVPTEVNHPGSILLRAVDYIIGGSYYIGEVMKGYLNLRGKDLLAKVENLIYAPEANLNELRGAVRLAEDIARGLSVILKEVRCIEVHLTDGDTLYLDGQLHTTWSTPHIPYGLANTVHNIKNYINKYFYQNNPFVLFAAPGYDAPTKELFSFILSLNSNEKKIARLTLCSHKLEHLETVSLEQNKKYSFIFGLWPWQFVSYRSVKKIGEFKPFYFEAQNKNFYLAEIELELTEPVTNRSLTLTGCALKTNPAEKTRFLIMSNSLFPDLEELATLYLNHWPNLEEAFQDFSRKVELFTYTANSQHFFSVESLKLEQISSTTEIKEVLNKYLESLELYLHWHFLPLGYENQDFSLLKEQFYDLKAVFKKQKGCTLATFQLPQGFSSQKVLEYLCCRLNEREITLDGERLWFLF